MRRGAFHAVDQAEHVGLRQSAEPVGHRRTVPARGGERAEQPIERAILAEEEDFVLAAEIVVEIARREVGGHGDVAHPGCREPTRAEDLRGRLENTEPAGLRAS